MSVASIRPAPGGSGDFGLVSDSDVKMAWTIRVTSKLDDVVSIRNYGQSTLDANGRPYLPIPYVTEHPTLPSLVCHNLSITQDTSGPLLWNATATFSSRPVSESQANQTEASDPLARRATFTWSSTQYQQAIARDINGRAVVNSAGDPYDPPVEIQRSRAVCTIQKNVVQIPGWILDYENAVNSDTFVIDGLTIPQYACRLSGIGLSEIKREKIAIGIEFTYRVFSCKLEFNRDLWHPLKVLDLGYRQRDVTDGSGARRIPIYEDGTSSSRPVTTPRLLNGSGYVLSNPSTTTARFNDFSVYPLKPFNAVIPLL